MQTFTRRLYRFIAIFVCLAATAPNLRAAVLNLRDGTKVTGDFTYGNGIFRKADGKEYPRKAVADVFLVTDERKPAAAGAENSAKKNDAGASGSIKKVEWPVEIEKYIKTARGMAEKYRGYKGVMILDHGEWTVQNDGSRKFRYHFIGLVLKEEARDEWQSITDWFEEGRSSARMVMARSIDPDGSVHELDPSTLKVIVPKQGAVSFNKRSRLLTGTIPAIKVGSLVEYIDEWESTLPEQKRLFTPGWRFQGDIPVVSSKLVIDIPEPLAGDLSGLKLQWLTKNVQEDYREPVIEKKDGRARYTWHITETPPIVPEPNMIALADVVMKIDMTLYPDWKELNEYNARIQSERMKVTPKVEAKAREITAGAETVDDKLRAVYHWVQQKIQYISVKSSRSSGWAGHPAAETLDKGYGDCTDVSILFCTLLKSLGIEAYPIIIRTADSGEAVVGIPVPDGNHCISQVFKPDGEKLYLDCTADSYRYPYFRPDDHGVWAINFIKGTIERITVPPPDHNMKESLLEAVLDTNADAGIVETNRYTGPYEAAIRGYWQTVPPKQRKEFMQRYLASRSPGAVLESFEMSDPKNLSEQLNMRIKYKSPGVGTRAGNLVILKVEQLEWDFSSDIALEKRKYPIENYTTREWKRHWEYSLPDGWKVKFLPDPIHVDNPHVSYDAEMRADAAVGKVIIDDRLELKTRHITPEDYPAYREALKKIALWSKNQVFLKVPVPDTAAPAGN